MRGRTTWPHGHGATQHIYFHPVDGRLVFAACLVIAALVAIGFALIASKCKKCNG